MGFAAEMKDFISGFEATANVGQKISDRRAKRDLLRGPTDEELNAIPDVGGSGVPQVEGGGAGLRDAKIGNRGGGKFAQQAYDYYRDKGLGDAHAKGIAANLQQESGGDPRVLSGARSGDNGKSFFAAQWQGDRLKNLYAFAGGQKPTLQQQLDFVLEEGGAGKDGMKSPYLDNGAVKAYQMASQAQDPQQAVSFYRDFYERPSADDIGKRIAHLDLIQDNGDYTNHGVATAGAGVVDTGDDEETAIPEPDQAAGDAGDDGQSYSPEPGVDVPEVETSMTGDVPQVAMDQQLLAGAPTPPSDEQARPVVWAERGGAIPEPHYAPGGAVDPYNPARDYTQPIPQTPKTGFVPRRVGQSPTKPTIAPGPTPSQLAFRKLQQKATEPAVDPGQTPKAVTPSYTPQIHYDNSTLGNEHGTGGGHSAMIYDPNTGKYIQGQPGGRIWKLPTPIAKGTMVNAYPGELTPSGKWMNKQITAPWAFDDGGVIPDPEETSFKKGGKVRRESQHVGGNVPGVELVDPGSRYNAADDDEYWQPAKPKARPAGASGASPKPKGKGKKALPKPKKAKEAATPELADPHTNVQRTVDHPPNPTVGTAEPSDAAKLGAQVGAMVGKPEQGPPMSARATPEPELADAPDLAIPDKIDQRVITGPATPPPAAVAATPPPEPDPMDDPAQAPVIPEQIDTRAAPQQIQVAPPVAAADPMDDPAHAPVIPERIDQRVIAGPAPQQGPAVPPPPQYARRPGVPGTGEPKSVLDYMDALIPDDLAKPIGQLTGVPDKVYMGKTLKEIIAMVDPAIVPQILEAIKSVSAEDLAWPATPTRNGHPITAGFARGGPVEQRQSWHAGGSTPGVAYNDPGTAAEEVPGEAEGDADADDRPPRRQPTPKLMKDVAIALDGGVKFLTSHFGLRGGGDGGIPTPEDQATPQAGAVRFAQGEGATTPEEIKGIDDNIDPQRQLDEGQRHMTRLAKTVQWYEGRGRKKEAQMAAASLMQYGAQRFGQLGSLAGAAYKAYQQGGDPQDLQHTVKFLESAYALVPDGASLEVGVDPSRKVLVATRTGADGETQQFDVTPDQLPGMIASVQNKSAYWKSIFSLADPAGARQQAGWQHAASVKQDDRRYNEGRDDVKFARAEAGRNATADRIDARGAARDEARSKAAQEKEARVAKNRQPDPAVVNPLLAAADAAKTALEADPEDTTLQDAYNQAASKLYDALPPGLADKGQWLRNTGHEKDGTWKYVSTQPDPAAPEAGAKQAKDGKWYKPDPARPGKYLLLEPAG